jgi:hypothetical protein
MNRKHALVVLVFISLAFLGFAFHHHEDPASHENCSICSCASHYSHSVFQSFCDITPPPSDILFILPEGNGVSLSYQHHAPYLNRAPPA